MANLDVDSVVQQALLNLAPAKPTPIVPKKKVAAKPVVATAPPPGAVLTPAPTIDPPNIGEVPPEVQEAFKKGLINEFALKLIVDTKKKTSEENTNANGVVKRVNDNLLNNDEFKRITDMVTENPMPGAKLAQEATDNVQEAIKKAESLPLYMNGIDLRPVAGLLDSWYGGKLAEHTPAPETAMDRQKLLAALNEKLADNAAKQSHFETMLFGNAQIRNPSYDQLTNQIKAVQGVQNTTGMQQGTQMGREAPSGKGGGGQDLDKARERFANKLASAKVPDLSAALEGINQYVPGGIMGWDGKTDIPGFTAGDKAKSFVKADSTQSKLHRQAVQSLVNVLLNVRSGSAVTDTEAHRLGEELGSTLFKTQAEYMAGIRKVNAFVAKVSNNFGAGAGKAVLDSYDAQGIGSRLPNYGATQAPAGAPKGPSTLQKLRAK